MTLQKKILIGSSAHPWNDPRILHKQAVSLAKQYDVELHIPAPFQQKEFEGVEIIGLPEWRSRTDRIRIMLQLVRRILQSDAAVVHFHDPELLPIGILLKIITGKKFIFDFHEEYQYNIIKRDWIPALLRRPLVNIYLLFERIACQMFDGVIGVIEDQLPALQEADNYAIIKNYPVLTSTPENIKIKPEQSPFQIVYLGDITRERGIKKVVEVAGMLSQDIQVTLHLIGNIREPDYKVEMEEIMQKYGIEDQVRCHGYLSLEVAMDIVQNCDVGFLPLREPKDFVRSLPVKMFDYMSAGLPIIMPNFPLSRDVITKHRCGLLVDSQDITDIVNKVRYLLENPAKRYKMGINGKNAALNNYSWQSQEKELLALYHRVLQDKFIQPYE